MEKKLYSVAFIFQLLFCCFSPTMVQAKTSSLPQLESSSFQFFTADITLRYPAKIRQARLYRINEKGIVNYYKQLQSTTFEYLLRDLRYFKHTLGLNDWLLYKLIDEGANRIFAGRKEVEQELLSWFLLSELGYDTRITYLEDKVFVSVFTDEALYEIPLIQDGNRTYANLTSYRKGVAAQSKELFLLNFRARQNGIAFVFTLKYYPGLPAQKKSKSIQFSFKEKKIIFEVTFDQTIIEVMEDYPYFSEQQYLEIPFSEVAHQSLVPKLQHLIEGLSTTEALQLLAIFTRSAFEYREDKYYFGRSKPMIAEEVLFYPYSDCEDRSAIYYQLVKILLDLPMIAIAYDDHLTIGIASSELSGDYIFHQGQKYYICDPTGPYNSAKIGKFPDGYKEKPYQIIGKYR